jgi:hypothetical protein
MKIVIDQDLPFGKSYNYTSENIVAASPEMQAVFNVDGVKGIYHVANFLAVERNAKFAWENILADIRVALGETVDGAATAIAANEHFGEVQVNVQMYKGVPIQVKVFDAEGEYRVSTGERFKEAFHAIESQSAEENYIYQRQWSDYGIRYGEKQIVSEVVVAEINATYPQERLTRIVEAANSEKQVAAQLKKRVSFMEYMSTSSWEERFQLLDQMADPEVEDIPLLTKALGDEQMSIRRLATVYLGMIEDEAVVPALTRALQDKSAAVRRTAGDCMSDLGLPQFESAMIEALNDKNKLVRWRAAMYLYETGTEVAIPALREAAEDKEFEVKLQATMALARIEEGEEAKGSVWKQMTESRQQ